MILHFALKRTVKADISIYSQGEWYTFILNLSRECKITGKDRIWTGSNGQQHRKSLNIYIKPSVTL